jgi:uncharacterized membrane protein YkoI
VGFVLAEKRGTQMRFIKSCLAALLFAGVLAGQLRAHGDEEKIALDKLPRAVMNAVKAKFPTAELKGASKETENGKTSYEVTLTLNQANHDVILTAEGKITAIEKVIKSHDLPRAVADALKAKYGDATIKAAEQISDADDKITAYEVQIVKADKKELEVKLDPEGKILNEEKKGKD